MMVYEYAPNGTLSEHLHRKEFYFRITSLRISYVYSIYLPANWITNLAVKVFEDLDWAARMRVIMGLAYCLQYMHHELDPPVAINDIRSDAIFMTDDYAAKVSIWRRSVFLLLLKHGEQWRHGSLISYHIIINNHWLSCRLLMLACGKKSRTEQRLQSRTAAAAPNLLPISRAASSASARFCSRSYPESFLNQMTMNRPAYGYTNEPRNPKLQT